ncbi:MULTISPECIES: hypothetical protein [Prochlorococcus]|uniref:hypothetical protein n=1 Tax=Prochlorococcus TaxID=1218 RepID=UPI000533715C|nr:MULTISPECIES: hypothetical protein [Prochlorococcus]KGG14182.1 hypothetical protein EV05_0072 [Prochlorococcus sp. MIT 0601]
MAYFQYFSEVASDCLMGSLQNVLEEVGLRISTEFSTHAQIFAQESVGSLGYKSKVNVLISWSDKRKRECSVEVRSDEPYLKRGTRCENITGQLRKLLPPKDTSNQLITTS